MERDFSSSFGTQPPGGSAQGDPLREQVRDTAREVKQEAREGLEQGRRVLEDVQERGRRIAEKARVLGNQGKERALRVAKEAGAYAEDHTAIVAVGALAIGILIGRYLIPEYD